VLSELRVWPNVEPQCSCSKVLLLLRSSSRCGDVKGPWTMVFFVLALLSAFVGRFLILLFGFFLVIIMFSFVSCEL